MKNLVVLLLVAVVGFFSYQYLLNGDNPLSRFLQQPAGTLPTSDAGGRELTPCQRCLATGQVMCSAPRCKDGQVPCSGPCLKLSDSGWQRMEGQDPNKLFKIYRVNGGSREVSQAHVGEVFEVRFGEFVGLGACKVCGGRTTVPCKICAGSGKVTCPVCRGEKVVVKTGQTVPPMAAVKTSAPPSAAQPVAAPRAPKMERRSN